MCSQETLRPEGRVFGVLCSSVHNRAMYQICIYFIVWFFSVQSVFFLKDFWLCAFICACVCVYLCVFVCVYRWKAKAHPVNNAHSRCEACWKRRKKEKSLRSERFNWKSRLPFWSQAAQLPPGRRNKQCRSENVEYREGLCFLKKCNYNCLMWGCNNLWIQINLLTFPQLCSS